MLRSNFENATLISPTLMLIDNAQSLLATNRHAKGQPLTVAQQPKRQPPTAGQLNSLQIQYDGPFHHH